MNIKKKPLLLGIILFVIMAILYINVSNISLLILKINKIPYTDDAFLEAIELNEEKKVSLFINAGIDVSANNNEPILTASMQTENADTIKKLIDKGANVNAFSPDGHTPLMYSIMADDRQNVKVLIENGADIELTNSDGMTALIFASWFGREEICRILMDSGAVLSKTDDLGKTALDYSKEKNYNRIEAMLEEYPK